MCVRAFVIYVCFNVCVHLVYACLTFQIRLHGSLHRRSATLVQISKGRMRLRPIFFNFVQMQVHELELFLSYFEYIVQDAKCL